MTHVLRLLTIGLTALAALAVLAPAVPAQADHRGARQSLRVFVDVPGHPRLTEAVVRSLVAQTGPGVAFVDRPRRADVVARLALRAAPPELHPLSRRPASVGRRCTIQPIKAVLAYDYDLVIKQPGRRGAILARGGDRGRIRDMARVSQGAGCRFGAHPSTIKIGLYHELADRMAADLRRHYRWANGPRPFRGQAQDQFARVQPGFSIGFHWSDHRERR
ncbi:MAG: hypothetical protein ACFB22_02190 [Rhodothalassiaceae bacterium]